MNPEVPQVLVIGLGNTLRGDDALGQIAAERISAVVDTSQVKVISQCAPTPELAAELARVSTVIFLDASADGPADEVCVQRVEETDDVEVLSHRFDAVALLGLSRRLYGHAPETFAMTIRGRSFDLRDHELTAEVDAACDRLVEKALQLIRTHLASA